MRVLIDIAHPAHIHYFRNFSRIFEEKGHSVLFTLRDKGIIVDLANSYHLKYSIRSRESKSKLAYGLKSVLSIYKTAKDFQPDLFLDMGTVFASPVAKLLGKPYIAFDDTESAYRTRRLHMPFTEVILTPEAFRFNLGPKQIKFKGSMEMMYLKENYFVPDPSIFDLLKISTETKFAILRFVSWDAHHDKGLSGFTIDNKIKTVHEFSKYAKVFISSEKELPSELEPYRIRISPKQMHNVLAYASIFFGEAATMASESALLGIPAIYLNDNWAGTTNEAGKYGLIHSFKSNLNDQTRAIEKGIELLKDPNLKLKMRQNRLLFIKDKIDVTAFVVWFVENYPDSAKIMKENPDFQKKFI